ncbi:PDZ/DHR/GLGF domain protein [Dictyocaulus viviparus]|uniref:PDZ/DHR/GLGF domain protein n=1 Tax=Dictyocaulus viviparus TaxID=29172 RepID=A0A0D8XJB2_DICVI|nr:PDZ/DHR/GLGF domain protein [Dictyocaulus viviparus]
MKMGHCGFLYSRDTSTSLGGATLISRISRHDQPPPPSSSLRNLINSQSTTPQLRNKGMPPTTVYRTVDIPFDESPATYQPRKDESITVVKVMMGTYPVHKGLGFSISIERGRPIIDSVIVDTPADRAGLLIGDRVIAINGEYLNNRNLPEINRMIHEAARIGEADVYIEKREAQLKNNVQLKSISSLENFDKARSVFIEKTTADSSLTDFKRKQYNRASRTDQPFPRDFSSLPRSTSTGSILESKRAVTQRSPTRQNFERTSNVRTEYRTLLSSKDASPQDYRVTSIHEKIGPGRLTDFVPEIERDTIGTINEERKEFRRASDEEPRLIRNYDLPPTAPSTKTTSTKMTSSPLISPSPRRYEDITINATPKKSTLPRNYLVI